MYERFTDRARKTMAFANQEAQRLNHEYIGTEHILLGLLKEGGGVGANALQNLGVELSIVRNEVQKIITPGPEMVTMGKLPLTPGAKKVIEHAIKAATDLGHGYVGTEHLLIALADEGFNNGVAGQVLTTILAEKKKTIQDIKNAILDMLGTKEDKNAQVDKTIAKTAYSILQSDPKVKSVWTCKATSSEESQSLDIDVAADTIEQALKMATAYFKEQIAKENYRLVSISLNGAVIVDGEIGIT